MSFDGQGEKAFKPGPHYKFLKLLGVLEILRAGVLEAHSRKENY
jgi:hypothetical protein